MDREVAMEGEDTEEEDTEEEEDMEEDTGVAMVMVKQKKDTLLTMTIIMSI